MIKINKITIERFRGIQDMTLDFDGQNHAICGPNGTGKSGVVDAIEFALTGDVSRLSGKGRGDVSVKKHAPHVDCRDQPSKAIVSLCGVVASSGKKFQITRSVSEPKSPILNPRTDEIQDVIDRLTLNKNVSLSRRELIQYVLSTPGDRASEIQALLQLHNLRELRKGFQKIANGKKRERATAETYRKNAAEYLAGALGIPTLTTKGLLFEVNKRRATLKLPPITQLDATTSVKDGLSVATEAAAGIVKNIAIEDLKQVEQKIENFTSSGSAAVTEAIIPKIEKLVKNPDFRKGIDRQDLLTRSLELVDEEKCPVCETDWNSAELIELIKSRIAGLKEIITAKDNAEKELTEIKSVGDALADGIRTICKYGDKLNPKIDATPLSSFSDDLELVTTVISDLSSGDKVLEHLKNYNRIAPEVTNCIDVIRNAVNGLADTSVRDAARDFLVAVQERLDVFRESRRTETKKIGESKIATGVFEIYERTHEKGLNDVYKDIEESFAELYRYINHEDEDAFRATMVAEKSGLGLDVDFFGRGKFPPGAYHSEGHQDGMGLCLYLALMQHLYGDGFQVCVLDDVLMSVDSGHRRSVCNLLMNQFSNTQFIFTTHDEVWLKNMQSSGLVKSKNQILFRGWTIEDGPSEWIAEDVWSEIGDSLVKNEIDSAAGKLRRYLEYVGIQLCHNLGADVVYRADNQHTLGDLFPRAMNTYLKLLKKGQHAAKSWGNAAAQTEIEDLEQQFRQCFGTAKGEQWAMNAKVHYNEWATLSKQDFQVVSDSFKQLLTFLECDSCGALVHTIPERGSREIMKCNCGNTNINLKAK